MKGARKLSCSLIKEALGKIHFDPDLEHYKSNLLVLDDLDSTICLPNQFFYVYDFAGKEIDFISINCIKILGYGKEELTLDFFYDIIHPKDKIIVITITQRILELALSADSRNEESLFCIDFRIRKSDNSYIRVLRQTWIYKKDNLGNILYTLSSFSDISGIKKENRIDAYIQNNGKRLKVNIRNTVQKPKPADLTKQETEVLKKILTGKRRKDIIKDLFICKNTYATHCRNILAKKGFNNMRGLVINELK
jgi:DNA-binding CsgD family transcriptional regulator